MTVTAASVIKVAKAEIGVRETRSGGHWVNDSKYNKWFGPIPGYGRGGYDYPYCAAGISWVADKSGAKALYPRTAGCATAVAWFKARGRFSAYPAVGAQVFFGPGGNTHTGLVVSYTATAITTVEFNTNVNGSAEGDGVYLKTHQRKDSYVYGYGYPAFAEGIKSADPAWAKDAPKAPTKPAGTAKPTVDLSELIRAAKTDPGAAQGHQTYAAGTKLVEAALRQGGFLAAKYASDGSFGTTTVTAYAKYQRSLNYSGTDANGVPGLTSLTKLGAKYGFGVKP